MRAIPIQSPRYISSQASKQTLLYLMLGKTLYFCCNFLLNYLSSAIKFHSKHHYLIASKEAKNQQSRLTILKNVVSWLYRELGFSSNWKEPWQFSFREGQSFVTKVPHNSRLPSFVSTNPFHRTTACKKNALEKEESKFRRKASWKIMRNNGRI